MVFLFPPRRAAGSLRPRSPKGTVVLGAITDQMTKLFHELMEELRGIRTELSLLRSMSRTPIASAAASLVEVQGGGTTKKAKVSSTGRLLIDTEAGQLGKFLETFSLTAPYGEVVLVSGSGSTASKTGGGDITGV